MTWFHIFSFHFSQAFKQYPATIEEMDDLIHRERARAECYFETDQQVVVEYEERKKEIDKLSKEVRRRFYCVWTCVEKCILSMVFLIVMQTI